MRKEDRPGVELQQARHPLRLARQWLGVIVLSRPPGEKIRAVCRSRVVTLACDDDIAVSTSDNQRLVSFRVSRCGDQEDPRQHLSLTVQLFVASCFDEFGQRIARRGPRRLQFNGLDEDWSIPDERVAPTVVEVQVAVGHMRHLIQTHGDGVQRSLEILPLGPVVSIDLPGRTHPGVKEKHPIRMYDDIPEASLDA